jgi:hypothetical protein
VSAPVQLTEATVATVAPLTVYVDGDPVNALPAQKIGAAATVGLRVLCFRYGQHTYVLVPG